MKNRFDTCSIQAGLTFPSLTNLLPRERRLIRNMAGTLNAAFQIPQGRELVLHLGLGGERSNLEALESWVCRQMLAHRVLPEEESLAWFVWQLEYDLSALEVHYG